MDIKQTLYGFRVSKAHSKSITAHHTSLVYSFLVKFELSPNISF